MMNKCRLRIFWLVLALALGFCPVGVWGAGADEVAAPTSAVGSNAALSRIELSRSVQEALSLPGQESDILKPLAKVMRTVSGNRGRLSEQDRQLFDGELMDLVDALLRGPQPGLLMQTTMKYMSLDDALAAGVTRDPTWRYGQNWQMGVIIDVLVERARESASAAPHRAARLYKAALVLAGQAEFAADYSPYVRLWITDQQSNDFEQLARLSPEDAKRLRDLGQRWAQWTGQYSQDRNTLYVMVDALRESSDTTWSVTQVSLALRQLEICRKLADGHPGLAFDTVRVAWILRNAAAHKSQRPVASRVTGWLEGWLETENHPTIKNWVRQAINRVETPPAERLTAKPSMH